MRIVAAFQPIGSAWHAVIARIEGQRPVLVEAKSFSAGTTSSAIHDWLASHHVGRVIGVLPGSAIISRTCTLPNGAPAQLDAALRLQAESQLLGSVPEHRMATAVLPAAEGESARCGLILGWPESSDAPIPPGHQPTTFAPVVASLAALLNGARPTEPIVLVDRKDGTMALALTHANGAVFRAARIEATTDERGMTSILRTLTETALSVGHTGQFVDELLSTTHAQLAESSMQDSALLLPSSLATVLAHRLHGAPTANEWWTKYGIAAGAILAASDELAPLTQLRQSPPATRPSRFGGLSTLLADQRVAMKVLAACIAIVILAPVAFSGMRLLILKVRYPGLEERLKEIDRSKQELAIYSDLRNHAWSMTKLLSDAVVSAPEGIELESIAIDHGKELRVQGTARSHNGATPNDVVLQMQTNMQQYGVFKDARPSWKDPNAQGTTYDFTLIARIGDPHKSPVYSEDMDFAGMTLADRRYGKQPTPGTSNTASETTTVSQTDPASMPGRNSAPPVSPTDVASNPDDDLGAGMPGPQGEDNEVALDETRRRPISTQNDRTNRADGAGSHGDGGANAPGTSRVPEELSAQQIAAMSIAEAQDAQAEVAAALRRAPNLDSETKARLTREFRQLQERVREGDK